MASHSDNESSHSDDDVKPTASVGKSEHSQASMQTAPKAKTADRSLIHELGSWQNPMNSGIVFGSITLFWYLVTFAEYTVISVIALLAMAVLITAWAYVQYVQLSAKYIKGKVVGNPFVEHFQDRSFSLDGAQAGKFTDVLISTLNVHFAQIQKVYFCEDNARVAQTIVALWVLSKLGGWFSMVTLFYFGALYVFVWTKVYELKQKEIDALYANLAKQADIYFQLALSKIPPAVTDKVPALKAMLSKAKTQ